MFVGGSRQNLGPQVISRTLGKATVTQWHYYSLLDRSAHFLAFLRDAEEKSGTLAKGHAHFTRQDSL